MRVEFENFQTLKIQDGNDRHLDNRYRLISVKFCALK